MQPLQLDALIFCCIILFFNGCSVFASANRPNGTFDRATFITSYFPIVFGPVLYFIYPYLGKNRQSVTVSPHEADFVSGSRDEEEEDVKPPKNFIMKIWAWIM